MSIQYCNTFKSDIIPASNGIDTERERTLKNQGPTLKYTTAATFNQTMIQWRFRQVDEAIQQKQIQSVFQAESFIQHTQRLWKDHFPSETFDRHRFEEDYLAMGIKHLNARNGVLYTQPEGRNGPHLLQVLSPQAKEEHCQKVVAGIESAARNDLEISQGLSPEKRACLLDEVRKELEQLYDTLQADKVDYYLIHLMVACRSNIIELSPDVRRCLERVKLYLEMSSDAGRTYADVDFVYSIVVYLRRNHHFSLRYLKLSQIAQHVQNVLHLFNQRQAYLEHARKQARIVHRDVPTDNTPTSETPS